MRKIEVIEKTRLSSKDLDQWHFLWKCTKSGHFFNSPFWYQSFRETFKFPCRIFLGYYDGQLQTVLAVFRVKRFGLIPCWSDADLNFRLMDKSSWLIADEINDSLIRTFYHQLKTSLDCLILKDIDENRKRKLKELDSEAVFNFNNQSLFGEISRDCLRVMPGKQRRNMLSRIRRNKKRLNFRFLKQSELFDGLKIIQEIEAESHKEERGISIFNDLQIRDFLSRLVKNGANRVRIGILFIDNKPAASIFGFAWGETFLSYHLAFRDEFRSIGAGKMAIYFAFEELRKAEFKVFDFSKGDSEFKRQFVDYTESHWDFFCSKSLGKRLIWKSFLLIRDLKRLIKT